MRTIRPGFTIIEVSLSLAVLLAAAILLTQFLVASTQQRRLADQRRLALEELSNRLEWVLAAKWDDVNAASLEKAELAQEHLPAAKLKATVTDEPGPVSGKRIRLEISWEQNGERVKALELTGWKYPSVEVRP